MIDDEETNEEEQSEKKKSGSSTVKIIIITVVLSLLIGGGLVSGTYYFVSSMNPDEKASESKKDKKDKEEDEDEEADEDADEEDDEADDEADEGDEEEDGGSNNKDKPAQYFPMDPKFVVSFHDQKTARFMQFEIEVMSREKKTFDEMSLHSAAIRSSLLMLFGGQNSDVMSTREGKEQLLSETVKDINATLVKITGKKSLKSAVEAAYFNSFVIQ